MEEIRKRFSQLKDMGISFKAVVMEMIGTGLFVLIGLLVAVYSNQETPMSDPIVSGFVVAFSFGMSITVMVYMTAHTSGGQLNPAVTTGCMAAGVTTPVQGISNIIAQCVGTVLSACFVMALVPKDVRDAADMAVSAVPEDSTVGQAFLAETIGMFMIVLTILETATHNKNQASYCAPIAIGTCFVLCILAFGPISSGGFNPARSFGPAVVSGNVKHLWIYIFGPVTGALLAAPVHLLSLSGWDTNQHKKTDGDTVSTLNSTENNLLPTTV